jgi:hypothetical protein
MKGRKLSFLERQAKIEQEASERRKVFKELLTHVSMGYSLDCFEPMSVTTIKKYLKVFKEEFIEEELEQAMRQGKNYWEGLGRSQSNGSCLGNSRSWYYNMANRYGWREKLDIEAEHKGNVQVNIVSYARGQASSDSKTSPSDSQEAQ